MSTEKIDFVIIWVDGNDPAWRKEKSKYDGSSFNVDSSDVRYRDWDNLQYWFRGVEKFAPWVNRIHFVTWGHLPEWLDTTNPKLNVVNHKDYIPEKYLPTFSSHTIELNLHRIPGIEEHFVYFNDDMFLTAPLKETDFFRNGHPCDTYAMNAIYFGPNSAGFFNGADMEVINKNFKKKEAIKRNLAKWYSPKNGFKHLVRTTLLLPWPWFPGIYYHHLPNSYLKSVMEEVWEKEEETLDATCSDRFRQKTNVNQWLFKFWQIASGEAEVRSAKIGRCYHIKDNNFESLCTSIRTGRYGMLCLNDTSKTEDFEGKKQAVIEAFEELLPDKSSFEKQECV